MENLLNNFHVDPTCAPTRSALMTGRYSDRVGVWHTVQGRNMLRRRETTTATPYYAYVTHKPTPGWQTPEGMGIPVYDPAYGRIPPQVKKR